MSYLKEAAEEQGLMEKIRFNWSTNWTFTFQLSTSVCYIPLLK